MSDWSTTNPKVIEEFRANEGRVGGRFEGMPMLVLHHRGRKSGRELVTPLVYLPDEKDADLVYIFGSKAGAPESPDWYYNLVAAGSADVERGAEIYPVTVTEITGAERDRVYAEQVRRIPGFGEYEDKTRSVRTIPVLALHRA